MQEQSPPKRRNKTAKQGTKQGLRHAAPQEIVERWCQEGALRYLSSRTLLEELLRRMAVAEERIAAGDYVSAGERIPAVEEFIDAFADSDDMIGDPEPPTLPGMDFES